ncbi:hypothetical protein B0H19DRAFT_1277197 [Mycena capillaripes]|nr:hypothetical protein B0H19DRAFT_1277197 [Mycena capillaripes]
MLTDAAADAEEAKDAAAIDQGVGGRGPAQSRRGDEGTSEAKATTKQAAALEKARADYEKELAHLTKLAAQKRDDAIRKAGRILTLTSIARMQCVCVPILYSLSLPFSISTLPQLTTNSFFPSLHHPAYTDSPTPFYLRTLIAQQIRPTLAVARVRLPAERDAWKERQAAEMEAHAAFAEPAKPAQGEREKEVEKVCVVYPYLTSSSRHPLTDPPQSIAAILKKRDARFTDADAARQAEERELEKREAEANNLKPGEVEEDKPSPGLLEGIGSFICGSESLATQVTG